MLSLQMPKSAVTGEATRDRRTQADLVEILQEEKKAKKERNELAITTVAP